MSGTKQDTPYKKRFSARMAVQRAKKMIASEAALNGDNQTDPKTAHLDGGENNNSSSSSSNNNNNPKDKEGETKTKRKWSRRVSRKQFKHHDIKIFTPDEYRNSSLLKQNESTVKKPSPPCQSSKEPVTDSAVNNLNNSVEPPSEERGEEENNNNTTNASENNNNITTNGKPGKHQLPAIILETPKKRQRSLETSKHPPPSAVRPPQPRVSEMPPKATQEAPRLPSFRQSSAPIDAPDAPNPGRPGQLPITLNTRNAINGTSDASPENGPMRPPLSQMHSGIFVSMPQHNLPHPNSIIPPPNAFGNAIVGATSPTLSPPEHLPDNLMDDLRRCRDILQTLVKQDHSRHNLDQIANIYGQLYSVIDQVNASTGVRDKLQQILFETYEVIVGYLRQANVEINPIHNNHLGLAPRRNVLPNNLEGVRHLELNQPPMAVYRPRPPPPAALINQYFNRGNYGPPSPYLMPRPPPPRAVQQELHVNYPLTPYEEATLWNQQEHQPLGGSTRGRRGVSRPRAKSHLQNVRRAPAPMIRRSISNPHTATMESANFGLAQWNESNMVSFPPANFPPTMPRFSQVERQTIDLPPQMSYQNGTRNFTQASSPDLPRRSPAAPLYSRMNVLAELNPVVHSNSTNVVTTAAVPAARIPTSNVTKQIVPSVVVEDNSMQITKEPLPVPPAPDHLVDNSTRTSVITDSSAFSEDTGSHKDQEEDSVAEFRVWLEKLKNDKKLKSEFLTHMGIVKVEYPNENACIEITDSDEDNAVIDLESPPPTTAAKTPPKPAEVPKLVTVKEPVPKQSLSKMNYVPTITLPYRTETDAEPNKTVYSPEIEPISPAGVNGTSFIFPRRSDSPDTPADEPKKRKSVERPATALSPRVPPSGKLCYIRDSHMLMRYYTDTQMELFIMNLSSSPDEELLRTTGIDLEKVKNTYIRKSVGPEQLRQTEKMQLPNDVEFSRKEDLANPEEFVTEINLVEQYVPKDFAGFYRYVTGFQIINKKSPVSLQTFLTMYNTNRIADLLRKYLQRDEEPASAIAN